MLQGWVWEDGSFKFKLGCPLGCGVREVRVGEQLDVLALLETSLGSLSQMVIETLERTHIRCRGCGVFFTASDSATLQFKREFLKRIGSDEAWWQGIKAYYSLVGASEPKAYAGVAEKTRVAGGDAMSQAKEHDWDEVLRQANAMVIPHGFRAEYFPGEEGLIRTVGVTGDERAYLPVLCLIGSNPDQEVWAALSTKITNDLPIGRVTIELARR